MTAANGRDAGQAGLAGGVHRVHTPRLPLARDACSRERGGGLSQVHCVTHAAASNAHTLPLGLSRLRPNLDLLFRGKGGRRFPESTE